MVSIRCDREPKKSDCLVPCLRIHSSCNHVCTKKCGQDCGECEQKVYMDSKCTQHDPHKMELVCKDVDKIWLYQEKCEKKCKAQLKCSHQCSSNKCCGYIHASCRQNCGRILYCGHKCEQPCSEQCLACMKKCENKCVHSRCNLKCSEPCVPCNEPCVYECEHSKCTKLCGELCDREACLEPCKKVLKCGHNCIGFCGEVCPPVCRLCSPEKVSEILFGYEDSHDARFVYLVDCKHFVESIGMEHWLRTEQNKESIQLPSCPWCKTPIRQTLRYSGFVKSQMKAIEAIKLRQFGDYERNKADQIKLKQEIDETKKEMVRRYKGIFIMILVQKSQNRAVFIKLDLID
jgi:hypothetical protein